MSAVARDTIVDLLARGISVRFQAHGDSMHPVILSGDYLLVEPVAPELVIRGDIVLSLTERGLTAHRVVSTGPATFTTRGDNAPAADAPFSAAQLLGRVKAVERDGRSRPMHAGAGVAVMRALRRVRRLVS